MDAKEAKLNRERNQADIFKKMSLGMIQELHAKEMQIKKLNIETHPELSGILLCIELFHILYVCHVYSRS